jgi:hypothetical protein
MAREARPTPSLAIHTNRGSCWLRFLANQDIICQLYLYANPDNVTTGLTLTDSLQNWSAKYF